MLSSTDLLKPKYASIDLVKLLRAICFCFSLLTSSLLVSFTANASPATILVFGDSVSAAYGMETSQGWVQLLSNRIATENPQYQVTNASVSGETTGGGLVRLEKALEVHRPQIVILELGGNDGLRGYPISKIEANLNSMVRAALASNAKILLVGMVLPPNYGKRYTSAFEAVFSQVSQQNDIPLVPFLLNGVATSESLMQRDGIHPKPEAQAMILNDIWQALAPLL